MATSGTMQGNSLTIGAYGGNYYFINWQLASQNTGGNYSTINWQCYMHYNQADAQLDNGYANLGGATRWSNGGRVYNFVGNYTTRDMGITSGSFNVGHDGAGNFTLGVDGAINVYRTGTTGGSASWALPTIPRYAAIDGFNINYTTDASIEFAWHSDSPVDYISWWSTAYDGGGHHDTPASGQGWFVIDLNNLASEKTFDITVAVRRADSGLWTSSGPVNTTTTAQNNFLEIL
jgi:hypothetical protein